MMLLGYYQTSNSPQELGRGIFSIPFVVLFVLLLLFCFVDVFLFGTIKIKYEIMVSIVYLIGCVCMNSAYFSTYFAFNYNKEHALS